MTIDVRKYGDGTEIAVQMPWSMFLGGRVLCSDGKVRALSRISQTADTFFSVPAAVRVGGKSVSGYVTFETRQGLSTPSPDDPVVAKFIRYEYAKNAALLPAGTYRGEEL